VARSTPADVEDLLPADQPIVLYDGVCNLCNGLVQFVVPRDSAERFRFAPLQSEPGQALLEQFGLDTDDPDTFVLVDGESVYDRSSAALRVARDLDLPWSLFAAFLVVPKPVRDAVYRLVARSRYRVFGRKDRCRLPEGGSRDVFLEGADVVREDEAE
jgi:predicted DCC family thiol-disulfide oxidoreductase YuxK